MSKELQQNIEDIKKFYEFLAHKTKTVFQVYEAMVDKAITSLPSIPSEQFFISHNNIELLLKLCNKFKLTGQICLGINERPQEQTKLTDILPKINVILFDIDVRKNKKVKGISPKELKKEAKEVARQCKAKLEELGFTTDFIIDSGNGYHIYIKIEIKIPNYTNKEEFENTDVYKRLVYLENQLRQFNTDNVEIDFLSKDVIRRVKIAGTYNIKRYKDANGKFRLMPKKEWRQAKILYLNENINEKKNNVAFSNLPFDAVEINEKTDGLFDDDKATISNNKILNDILKKDEKLQRLYKGDTTEHKSRSEAELSFIIGLLYHAPFLEGDIYNIMDTCQIGKWNEKGDSYKKLTIKKAFEYVQTHPKKTKKPNNKLLKQANIDKKKSKLSKEEFEILYKKYKKILKFTGILYEIEKKEDLTPILSYYNNLFGDISDSPIKYDNNIIILSDNGVFLLTNKLEIKEILNKPIIIKYKAIDVNKNSTELFSFNFNDVFYRNYSIKDTLKVLEPYIQKYSQLGRDIIKKYLNYLSVNNTIKEREPAYVLGWNNGWFLPQNEKQKNMTIITHTEIQEEIYTNIKERLIASYSKKEIKSIIEKMKLSIEKTQTDRKKLSIIIAWSISAPFRMYFIKNFQLFILLYFCGNKETGKSSLGDLYITNLYNIFNEHLSPSILNSVSQTEDHLASSTFPLNFQEVFKIKDLNVMDILKDTTTSNSRMIRKNPDQSFKINKLKIAPISLDGNKVLKQFMDEAWNSKMLFLKFNKDDIIKFDEEWVNSAQELKEKKLFSLVYEYTKDWNDNNINIKIKQIKRKYKENVNKLYKIDSRLAKTYIILLFGIELFEDIFEIELEKDIINCLIESRTYISEDLTDLFINFCNECVNLGFQEGDPENPLRNIPYYLKHSLDKNRNDEYVFTQLHLADFNKLNKSDYRLSELYDLLSEDSMCNGSIKYRPAYSNLVEKTVQSIVIKKRLLDDIPQKITDFLE